MAATYTPERTATAGKLCEAAKGMPANKAAMAAMVADAFINGMNLQQRLTSGHDPKQLQA